MKCYLAPMEGITGYIYRNAYKKYFHNLDKYFTPFIIPNQNRNMKSKELNDILPENNKNINIVPQILTNNPEDFILTAKKLEQFGYNEINLNLGCPSQTVVSKGKGSGFLAKKQELDKFLEKIYKNNNIKISIKTRIGKDSEEEFYELLNIYNKYPIEELIIHPRTQKDYYKNEPNLYIFDEALKSSTNNICYNGDIFTVEKYNDFIKSFPMVNTIMLGRGILTNPGLIGEIKEGKVLNKEILRLFHDEILNEYIELLSGDRNVLFKMKELWSYMIHIFSNNKKYLKKIKKSQNLREYTSVIISLFNEEEIVQGMSLFS